jgi:hypothetical protein
MTTILLRYSVPSAKFWTLDRAGNEGNGRMKLSGEHSAAAMRARLKFKVERVLKVAPSRRREKDCVIWTCWIGSLARDWARKMGRMRDAAAVAWNVVWMNCVALVRVFQC